MKLIFMFFKQSHNLINIHISSFYIYRNKELILYKQINIFLKLKYSNIYVLNNNVHIFNNVQ